MLKERRIKAHDQAIERIKTQAYYYHAQPHPNDVAAAQAAFKRGIDEDWQSSVQRYPEVLEYYYGLVELQLPSDDDPKVRDPPLSALSGSRKARRPAPATITSGPDMGTAPPPQQQQPPPPPANRISAYPHQREVRGRTPPPRHRSGWAPCQSGSCPCPCPCLWRGERLYHKTGAPRSAACRRRRHHPTTPRTERTGRPAFVTTRAAFSSFAFVLFPVFLGNVCYETTISRAHPILFILS